MMKAAPKSPFSINLLEPKATRTAAETHDKPNQNSSGFHRSTNATTSDNPFPPITPDENFAALLPASYRTKLDGLALPSIDAAYLGQELGVDRLNRVHQWLWTVGRPMPPRALHHQKLLGREIVVTEQMDMHLVWSKGRIFIKPIPRFLLDPDFWVNRLACAPQCGCSSVNGLPSKHTECDNRRLWKCALGFLFSYTALISHESDFILAQENHLIPKEEPKWQDWKAFVHDILHQKSIYQQINERYWYGELRLGRLNIIYRFTQLEFLRGYMAGHDQYSSFLQDNLAWIASLAAYIAIVLTAMQVGLATKVLSENASFQSASYGFTVFSIIGPLVAVAIVWAVFCIAFVSNWMVTKQYGKKRLDVIKRENVVDC